MPDTIPTPESASFEDACIAAAIDYRYAAEQLDRTARYLRAGRHAEAELSMKRAIEGVERAQAAFDVQ